MLCGCGQQVLQVGDPPFLIDAESHPLGIWRTDGTKLAIADVLRGERAHRRHATTSALCGTGQLGLFGGQ